MVSISSADRAVQPAIVRVVGLFAGRCGEAFEPRPLASLKAAMQRLIRRPRRITRQTDTPGPAKSDTQICHVLAAQLNPGSFLSGSCLLLTLFKVGLASFRAVLVRSQDGRLNPVFQLENVDQSNGFDFSQCGSPALEMQANFLFTSHSSSGFPLSHQQNQTDLAN
jgi:hypothetical protein